jgi:Fe-S-cluster containining protein
MNTIPVKVSTKSAVLKFHGCTVEYIRDVCHARCCFHSGSAAMVAIHPSEEHKVRPYLPPGVDIIDGMLTCGTACTFIDPTTHLCTLHQTDAKPFGCIASPFTLNSHNTLVIRYRYVSLKCYNDGPGPLPAYVAYRTSLDTIFGLKEANRICVLLAHGVVDPVGFIPQENYEIIRSNDLQRISKVASVHA